MGNSAMDINSSFFTTLLSILLGGLLTIITSILVQSYNYRHEKKANYEDKCSDFFDELLSKLPIEYFSSNQTNTRQEQIDYYTHKWFEKRTILACYKTKAILYTSNTIQQKLNDLYDITNIACLNIRIPNIDETGDLSYMDEYTKCLNELIELIKKEIKK